MRNATPWTAHYIVPLTSASLCKTQVWYDTTLTKNDKPSVCTAFMVTLPPTDGSAKTRKASAPTILLPTTVLPTKAVKDGCNVPLPVLCM